MDIDKAKLEFIKYTNDYKKEESHLINLKIDHTFRVMDLCKEIADSLGLSEEKVDLARLCGLLHDLGRFEQVKQTDSFSDRKR